MKFYIEEEPNLKIQKIPTSSKPSTANEKIQKLTEKLTLTIQEYDNLMLET